MIDSSLSIKLLVIVHERLKRRCHFRGRKTIEGDNGLIDYMTIVDDYTGIRFSFLCTVKRRLDYSRLDVREALTVKCH